MKPLMSPEEVERLDTGLEIDLGINHALDLSRPGGCLLQSSGGKIRKGKLNTDGSCGVLDIPTVEQDINNYRTEGIV
jgi:hypothetical protein